MNTMSSTFAIETAETVTDHVSGSTKTVVRWRLPAEAEGPVVQGDDGSFYVVTRVVFVDQGTGDSSLSFVGHPVTAKNHRLLTHDRRLPIPIPVSNAKAALLSFGGEGGQSLESVRIVKSASRRTIDDRFFALQLAEV